jgi:hypothetical protein
MSYICQCGQVFDLVAALDQKAADSIGCSGMFSPACVRCGESFEVRLKSGGYDVGYSYFGGSMHFEAMHAIRVRGMSVSKGDPDDLDVRIGDRHWHFGMRRLSRQRFIVFPQAFAAGRPLGALDFARFDVSLLALERAQVSMACDSGTLVQAEDSLHLEGPAPALTRAWHYMNDGRI